MNFTVWKKNFLSTNNRESMLGLPLYAYKMSSTEFSDLKQLLTNQCATYLMHWDINEVFSKSNAIPELFVLYAAMWWQREYDGSGMNWEPIFGSIKLNANDLNSNIRSNMIDMGLRYWKISLNNDIGNLKYIGNIASQGGLPLKLIASDNNGNLNRLLNRILKDVVNLAFPDPKSISNIIESRKNELLKSYRQPLVYNLLAEIINTFIFLKTEAKLEGASNPIEKLNQFKSNWRDSFPLSLDDENARGVLERFIQEGVRIRAEKPAFTLSLNRYLQLSESTFQVVSRVDLPKHNIDEESVKKAFDINDDFLTRVMYLKVSNHQETHENLISKLGGQSNYRFNDQTMPLFKDAENEHFAVLKNTENVYRNVILANGYELDEDTPWIFEASDEGHQGEFLKLGAGKFRSPTLYVVVPNRFSCNLNLKPIANALNKEKACYLISEPTTFFNAESERYEIVPNSSEANLESFELIGNRLWHVFQKPAVAFKGYPQIVKYVSTTSTLKNRIQINAQCRNLDNSLLSPSLGIYGPLNLSVKEKNSNVWGSKVVALPSTASYHLIPGENTNLGRIELSSWNIQNVRCLDENVSLKLTINKPIAAIECEYIGSGAPNELINLELYWPNNPKTATIQLPFPSTGVIAFDEKGKQLNKSKPLSLQQLYGVRVVSLLGNYNFIEIIMSLKDTGNIRVEPINIRLKRDMNHARLEIRLIDYKEQIADLLFAVDHLDSRVEFKVRVPGAEDFRLFITKYDIQLEHEFGTPTFSIKQSEIGHFDNTTIKNCKVLSTRLDEIDDILMLNQSISEGVYNGIWNFPIQNHTQGCWIVHPSLESSIQFRPMMLPLKQSNEEHTESRTKISFALAIANRDEREEIINTVINELIEDFNHKDWLHVEYLAQHLGYLSLTSLDLWRLFAKNRRAMAALAIRESKFPEHFIERFSTELPFIWEFVSLEAWQDAAFNLKLQLNNRFEDDNFAKQYFEFSLVRNLNLLLVNHPSLNMTFEFIKYKNGFEVNKDMQFVLENQKLCDVVLEGQLFDRENSLLQDLLRRDDNHEWPDQYINEVKIYKESEHQSLLCPQEFGFKESVINFPFILAINALTRELPEWLDNESAFLDIKNIKNFDRDWFSSAFDKTIARAITKGYVQL